jgi:hypothetical protein
LDCVVRVRSVEVHFQIQCEADLAVAFGDRALMQATGLAALNLEKRGANVMVGNDGVAGLDKACHLPSEAVSQKGQGFLQAGMTGLASAKETAEFSGSQAAADLSLERGAALGSIHHTLDMDSTDLAADTRDAKGQEVHDEARVYAGGDDTGTGLLTKAVQARGEFGLTQLRKEQLLTGGNDADAGLGHWFKLGVGSGEAGNGGVKDHVGPLFGQQARKGGIDLSSTQGGQAGHLGQVLIEFGWVDINAAQDLGPGFGGGKFEGLDADGSETELGQLEPVLWIHFEVLDCD